LQVFSNIVCSVCGCCCDDIEVAVEDGRIVNVKNACALSAAKFENLSKHRNTTPLVRKNGKLVKASLEEAVSRSAEILANSRYPVLYGWSSTSCEAIKVGLELAEEVGGVIDNTSTVCHGPSILAVQNVGLTGTTLGQIRHRADLIIYWGSNPWSAHPRHMERYTALSEGKFQKSLWRRLSKRFRAKSIMKKIARIVNLVSVETLEEVADVMINCKLGVIFFGLGLTMSSGKLRNVEAAIKLTQDLNSLTKFLILPMRGHFNVTGANTVFTWQTGYPYAVDFSQGYPRYNPGETSAIDILRRGDSDAALVLASDPVSNFPHEAAQNLVKNPLIVIDPHLSPTALMADVVIPSAFVGIEVEGTAYRMDHVPLPLRKIVNPPEGCLPDEEILRRILQEVRRIKTDAG